MRWPHVVFILLAWLMLWLFVEMQEYKRERLYGEQPLSIAGMGDDGHRRVWEGR